MDNIYYASTYYVIDDNDMAHIGKFLETIFSMEKDDSGEISYILSDAQQPGGNPPYKIILLSKSNYNDLSDPTAIFSVSAQDGSGPPLAYIQIWNAFMFLGKSLADDFENNIWSLVGEQSRMAIHVSGKYFTQLYNNLVSSKMSGVRFFGPVDRQDFCCKGGFYQMYIQIPNHPYIIEIDTSDTIDISSHLCRGLGNIEPCDKFCVPCSWPTEDEGGVKIVATNDNTYALGATTNLIEWTQNTADQLKFTIQRCSRGEDICNPCTAWEITTKTASGTFYLARNNPPFLTYLSLSSASSENTKWIFDGYVAPDPNCGGTLIIDASNITLREYPSAPFPPGEETYFLSQFTPSLRTAEKGTGTDVPDDAVKLTFNIIPYGFFSFYDPDVSSISYY